MHVPLGIEIPALDNHHRAGGRFRHNLHLPQKVAVDQGINKVPRGLALNEDPVADCVIPVGEAFDPDLGAHVREHLYHL